MKGKTPVKAGGVLLNHTETLARIQKPAPGLKIWTHVKAGIVVLTVGILA